LNNSPSQLAQAKLPREHRSSTGRYKLLPRWKKALLGVSVAFMVTGLILQGYCYLQPPAESQVLPVHSSPQRELLTTRNLSPELAQSTDFNSITSWSPAIFRMGFGFFAGFCIAYLVRTFIKFCAIAAGAILLALLGLQWSGVVNVDWIAIQDHYDTLSSWLERQLGNFHQFATGFLPSSALTTLGAVVGFLKNRS